MSPACSSGRCFSIALEDHRNGEDEDPAVPEERARADEHPRGLRVGLLVERLDGERGGLGRRRPACRTRCSRSPSRAASAAVRRSRSRGAPPRGPRPFIDARNASAGWIRWSAESTMSTASSRIFDARSAPRPMHAAVSRFSGSPMIDDSGSPECSRASFVWSAPVMRSVRSGGHEALEPFDGRSQQRVLAREIEELLGTRLPAARPEPRTASSGHDERHQAGKNPSCRDPNGTGAVPEERFRRAFSGFSRPPIEYAFTRGSPIGPSILTPANTTCEISRVTQPIGEMPDALVRLQVGLDHAREREGAGALEEDVRRVDPDPPHPTTRSPHVEAHLDLRPRIGALEDGEHVEAVEHLVEDREADDVARPNGRSPCPAIGRCVVQDARRGRSRSRNVPTTLTGSPAERADRGRQVHFLETEVRGRTSPCRTDLEAALSGLIFPSAKRRPSRVLRIREVRLDALRSGTRSCPRQSRRCRQEPGSSKTARREGRTARRDRRARRRP